MLHYSVFTCGFVVHTTEAFHQNISRTHTHTAYNNRGDENGKNFCNVYKFLMKPPGQLARFKVQIHQLGFVLMLQTGLARLQTICCTFGPPVVLGMWNIVIGDAPGMAGLVAVLVSLSNISNVSPTSSFLFFFFFVHEQNTLSATGVL